MGPFAAQHFAGRLGSAAAGLVAVVALGLISPPAAAPTGPAGGGAGATGSLVNPDPFSRPPGPWPLEPLHVNYRLPPPVATTAGTVAIPEDRFDDLFENGWIYGPGRVAPRATFDEYPPIPAPRSRPRREPAGVAFAGAGGILGISPEGFRPPTLAIYSDIVLGGHPRQAASAEPRTRVPRQRRSNRTAAWDVPVPALIRITAVLFLSAVIAVPAGCSFAAGALYAHPRDGPHRPAGSESERWVVSSHPASLRSRSLCPPCQETTQGSQRPRSCLWTSRQTSTPTAIIPINVSVV